MRFVIIFIMSMCMISAHAAVDRRQYVDWSAAPYNRVVALADCTTPECTSYYSCTAQYIAPDIIVTALHCIDHGLQEHVLEIELHDGRKSRAVEVVAQGKNTDNADWAVLRVTDEDFYSENFFPVTDAKVGPISQVGFGYMRIIGDTELAQIKTCISNAYKNYTYDANDADSNWAAYWGFAEGICGELKESLKDRERKGRARLKLSPCEIRQEHSRSEKAYFEHDCESFGGNSGGVFFNAGNALVGIEHGSIQSFKATWSLAVRSDLFKGNISKFSTVPANWTRPVKPAAPAPTESKSDAPKPTETKIVQPKPTETKPAETKPAETKPAQSVPDVVATLSPVAATTPVTETVSTADISAVQQQLEEGEKEQFENLQNIDNMSDTDFLKFLDRAVELDDLRKKYEQARAREQSLANRLLGAAAIGAGGIGGMMLASGMAEQAADEAAERDMRAYLETFRCDYGAGKNIKGGETGIELPGGNDLTELYAEYVALAESVRTRKDALNLRPGIEAEPISDRVTGLYNNAAIGRTGGAYTSVARAIMDENSEDAAAWAQQKQDAQSKTKTGAVVAGVGIVGGAIGNAIINHDSKADDKEDKEKDKEKDKKDKKDDKSKKDGTAKNKK